MCIYYSRSWRFHYPTFFTDEAEVAAIIRQFLWILPLGYGLQGVVILTNSSLNALHLPKRAWWLSVIRLFVFYIPLAWLGSLWWGPVGLFAGALLANVANALVARWWFARAIQQLAS